MKIIEEAKEIIQRFEHEDVPIREGLNHNAQKVLRMCDFYSNSKYLGGNLDALGREKPFLNIVNFRVTVAKVATDLDIKDITISSDNPQHWVKSMLLQKESYEWMKRTKFGVSLNEQGYQRPKYGMTVVKKRMEDGELYVDTVSFKNFIFDQKDWSGAKLEKHFLTPDKVMDKEDAWDNVREVVKHAMEKAKDGGGDEDYTDDRIEIHELHHRVPKSFLLEAQNKPFDEEDEWTYVKALFYYYPDMDDMVLFAEEVSEKEETYKMLGWENQEGRTMGRGVIEEAEEAQVWVNDSVQNEKNAMDLASRVVLKTNSTKLANNVLEVDNGKIFELGDEEDINTLQLTPTSLGMIEGVIQRWNNVADKNTSTFDANTGEQPPANTPYSQTALLNQVASRPFDYRREEHGFLIEEIFYDWVLPHLIKKLKKEHILVSEFTQEEIEFIDADFSNLEGRNYAKEMLLEGKVPTEAGLEDAKNTALKNLNTSGDKRYIKVPKGYFDDIEAKVSVITTGEHRNKAAVLTSLSSVLQTVSQSYDPNTQTFTILENPTLAKIFGTIVEVAGAGLSPVSLMGAGNKAAPVNTEAIQQLPTEPVAV